MDEEKKPNFLAAIGAMFGKLFKKKEDAKPQSSLVKGLIIGVAIALILLVVILAVLFATGIFGGKPAKAPVAGKVNVKVTVLTRKNCPECWDTKLFTDALKQQPNINVIEEKTSYISGLFTDGKILAKKYNITKVPTVLIEGNLSDDKELVDFLVPYLGDMTGNVFVLRKVIPPYIDVASGKLKGKVTITYLTDKSCTECYDVMVHEKALVNIGIPTNNSKTIDIGSAAGQELVRKYNIKKVPTILMSGELSEYEGLAQVWEQVGTVSADGTYIFESTELMGKYKDLTTNKIMEPSTSTATTTAQ